MAGKARYGQSGRSSRAGAADEPNWVAQDLRDKELRHVYLLHGEEAYLRRYYGQALVKALVPAQDDGMNYTVLDGERASVDAIREVSLTLPFFAEHRTVLVKDSGLFQGKKSAGADAEEAEEGTARTAGAKRQSGKASGGGDPLLELLQELPETTYLIFIEKEVNRAQKRYKAVKEIGRAVEYGPLTGVPLRNWVAKGVKSYGHTIREETADYLIEQTGNDLVRLRSEIAKLVAYADSHRDETDEILKSDIDGVVTSVVDQKAYMLTGAVAERRRGEAIGYYHELLAMKAAEPMGLIAMITRQFNQMLQIKELRLAGVDDDVVAKQVGVSSVWRMRKLGDIAARYSRQGLIDVIEDCARAQEDIKQGRVVDRVRVEMLIMRHTV